MHERARALISYEYLGNFLRRNGDYTGVEVELPLIRKDGQAVEQDFAWAFTDYMEEELGFCPVARAEDGLPFDTINRLGDHFGFEDSFNLVKFTLRKSASILDMSRSLYEYLLPAQHFLRKNGHQLCGLGINPNLGALDPTQLHVPSVMIKSQFMRTQNIQDAERMLCAPAATRTYLESRPDKLVPMLNLLIQLSFLDGYLFSNSPAPGADVTESFPGLAGAHPNELCYRDTLIELCRLPNRHQSRSHYGFIGDVEDDLLGLEAFYEDDGEGGLRPIAPIDLGSYFENPNHPDSDIDLFRANMPVSPSKRGTIEIRRTCTQPLNRLFEPAAFYKGISHGLPRASALIKDFTTRYAPGYAPAALRHMVTTRTYEELFPTSALDELAREMISIAHEGLSKRGWGEEVWLNRLHSLEHFECPAIWVEGRHMDEVLEEYSRLEPPIALWVLNSGINEKGLVSGHR